MIVSFTYKEKNLLTVVSVKAFTVVSVLPISKGCISKPAQAKAWATMVEGESVQE